MLAEARPGRWQRPCGRRGTDPCELVERLPAYYGEFVQPKRQCGINCEDTGEVLSRPGLTQELTGFVPCQRFVGWGGLGASLNHRITS
jgi:hypothetical protein